MSNGGYIKLHRRIEEWEWYDCPNTLRVFLHLLLHANHEPKKWHGITVDRGQLITSTRSLSESLGLSTQEVRTALEHLKSTNNLTIKATNKFQLVTVENYTKYQGGPDEINKQINKQSNNQTTTNKNDKKIRNQEISLSIYTKPILYDALGPEDLDRLTSEFAFMGELMDLVCDRLNKRKRNTPIKNLYGYIKRAAIDEHWPTVEEEKQKREKQAQAEEFHREQVKAFEEDRPASGLTDEKRDELRRRFGIGG